MDESVRAVVRETQTALQALTDQHELLKKVHAKLAHDYKNALSAAADVLSTSYCFRQKDIVSHIFFSPIDWFDIDIVAVEI